MKSTNPYMTLSSNKFWKSGVVDPLESGSEFQPTVFQNIWNPKFILDKKTRFSTVGSCFAQHISRWLIANKYNWIDSEPAGPNLTSNEIIEGGYGIFSFRTGNIYTAELFKQWIYAALGKITLPEEFFQERGKFFDCFRPLIPSEGFDLISELLEARAKSLSKIRASFIETDVLIFTLGLTEAWVNTRTGFIYPNCPGTLGGDFNPKEHKFKNYGFNEIKKSIEDAFDAIKSVNPGCRFILTVSPVPLTATASEEHVLTATIHSKSILRAVAGALKLEREDVDYFPSFELISSFPMRARYYEKNLRSVKSDGVNFVMENFSRGLTDYQSPEIDSKVDADVICEEVMLERFSRRLNNNQKSQNLASLPDVLIFGDSHIGFLSDAFEFFKIDYLGDSIMNGRAWYNDEFSINDEDYLIPLETRGSRERWLKCLKFFDHPNRKNCKIITNICVQSHYMAPLIASDNENSTISPEIILEIFNKKYKNSLNVLSRLIGEGYHVVVISDPPIQHNFEKTRHLVKIYKSYEDVIRKKLNDIGVDFFCVRDHFRGDIPECFYPRRKGDWIHGSFEYYAYLTHLLCGHLSIPMQSDIDSASLNMNKFIERYSDSFADYGRWNQ